MIVRSTPTTNALTLRSALPFATLGWTVTALAAGLLIARLDNASGLVVIGLVAAGLLALISPLSALVLLLVVAPLRTLIATESPVQLPLDVGQLTLLALVFFWFVFRVGRRSVLVPSLRSSVVYALLGFIVIGLLNAFSAWSLGAWLTEWLKWAQMLTLVLVVLTLGKRDGWRWAVFALSVAAVANALIGIYEFFGGSGALHLLIDNRFFRAFGTFGQPNPFGGFMGLVAPLALMAFVGYALTAWTAWRRTRRLPIHLLIATGWYGIASALTVAGVFISWSRGAWLAFGLSVLVIAFALPRRIMVSVIVLVSALVLVGLLWSTGRLPASIVARVNSATEELFAFNDVRGVDITPENYAVVERLAHWQAALNMARAYPWLGVGLGNYEVAYPAYRLINWKFPLGHAHNYYLNVFAEAGMIGLVSYGLFWASVTRVTWRVRRHPNRLARCVAIGLLGTWTYLAVHSLTDNLYVNNLFLHLGVMLGILAVLYRQTNADVRLGVA